MSDPAPKRRWFRFSLRTLFVVVAVVLSVWLTGRWWLVVLSFAWGAVQGLAMLAGMRVATPEAWERKPNRLMSAFVVGSVLLLLFPSVVVGLVIGGVGTGLAQIPIVVLGLNFARLFGPAHLAQDC